MEASRFDWAVPIAQRAALGDCREIEKLNTWINDWSKNNPPYKGINWKCGQEASIRVIHLLLVAYLLKQDRNPQIALRSLIYIHLCRIFPTLSYSIGQSNNHGTSEACALFVGGSFIGGKIGSKYEKVGRKLLEDRARKLICNDGTFSQYSTVYHRLMIDTYCFAETWRLRHKLSPFSDTLLRKLELATEWMEQLTCVETGDAPNLGANDGAHIVKLTNTDFRDFRPSLQLASNLFRKTKIKSPDVVNQQLKWLTVKSVERHSFAPRSKTFNDGGLHVLRNKKAIAYMRYPRFKFRPSQADLLHLDFWVNGINILRDAGSFSYNASQEDLTYFSGTSSHNTVQFDSREQMPSIGRFLFGNWLKTHSVGKVTEFGNRVEASASYRDEFGVMHSRKVVLTHCTLKVEDKIYGFKNSAVLRWRLLPGKYSISKNVLTGQQISLKFESSMPIKRIELIEGKESLYYLVKSNLPVLELEFQESGNVVTSLDFVTS